MWMSPNQNNMDKRLHGFTSLQTDRDLPRCDPSPLENVRNWRSSYPCLATTLDSKGGIPKFEIILIETSYKLMSEFPPPKATLGLRLELDFGQLPSTGPGGPVNLYDWTCTTHIYRNGMPVKPPSHYRLECNRGMVAPPFESMWWALTFIERVEQRKQAEETGKRDICEAAQEKAHQYFTQLTAVHEIRARPHVGAGYQGSRAERELVAVLLWKFSIAPDSYVGTTSWQRLLPPPDRITTNSPSPNQQEMSLPPLAMDTMVEGLQQSNGLDGSKDLLNDHQDTHYQDYDGHADHPNALLGHHDFVLNFKEDDIANFASMQSSFMPSSHDEHEGQSFQTLDPFDYNIQLHGLNTPSQAGVFPPASSNLFENQHVNHADVQSHHPEASQSGIYEVHSHFERDHDDSMHRRPLEKFDHNTHNMLQVQLAEPTPQGNKEDNEEDRLRAALAAASAMSDLGNAHTNVQHHLTPQAQTKQDGVSDLWQDIPTQRLQLHPQASYTSHASYVSHHEQEANAESTVNSNAFEANQHIGPSGHDYNPSVSSPEVRRLLELNNPPLTEEQHQYPGPEAKQDLDSSLGGSFVLVESEKVNGD
jgi:hypothetical protein